MATKKKVVGKKAAAVVAPKKKTAPKKKKAAGKKAAGAVAPKKKTAPKKKAAGKKAAAVVAPKKKTAPKKKATVKKAAAAVKKVVKKKAAVAVKKVVEKKAIVKKTIAKKTAAKEKPAEHKIAKLIAKAAFVMKPTIDKIIEAVHPKHEKVPAKQLSRNQLKKSSAKKRSSERETLLDDTYTSNPKTPKNTLPVDPKALKLAKAIVNAIEEKKGENIVCLDLRNIENRVCDYFIICEGNSTTQIDAIAGSVEFLVKRDLGERPYRSEGYENKTWILIDYVNVIVHVFDKETRYFYNLESLWADGERISF